ncbi:AAA family ATPase [Corallibacter sp.]|uniref:AAA family ATPase n=1 Tax=Corallibacter sp. TaxID=2038084 RepID=UPI003AB509E2
MFFQFQNELKSLPLEFLNDKVKLLYNWGNESKDLIKPIGDFSKVNLFVGSNNSGKSRFLRGLIKIDNSLLHLSSSSISLDSKYRTVQTNVDSVSNFLSHREKLEVQNNFNSIRASGRNYNELISNYKNFEKSFEFFSSLKRKSLELISGISNRQIIGKNKKIITLCESIEGLKLEIEFIKNNRFRNKKYIPILRSIHSNEFLTQGSLKDTIKKNYGIAENVFTGLDIYTQVLELKNSPGPNRKKVKQFEKFLSIHFFNNKEVEITSNSKSKELLFSIDEREHPIYDLGDGIQSLIILLFPIFTANNNDWFFIEEPEINLHPGLQRIFIEALLNDKYLKSKNLKYFFTTHSNHFMDITLYNSDISIFQFQYQNDDTFKIKRNVKPNQEILDLLGVNTSSVFLANSSIWVEGPTDRKYISKFLKLFSETKHMKHLKEDIDFTFFEYGGNLIEHYLFDEKIEFDEVEVRDKINAFALSNKIYLLADNDGVDKRSAKGKRRKALEEISQNSENFKYQNTILREIENLLPTNIISAFMLELVKPNVDLSKLKNIIIERNEYANIGLGEFYEKKLLENGFLKNELKSFKAPSGTLMNNYKIKLSSIVENSEYDYDTIFEENKELEDIITNIFSFVNND